MREKLIDIFLQKNKELNLSAIRDREGVMIKHIQDSLELINTGVFTENKKVADIGTGGGFPLLPLAISLPNLDFTGIDSIRKKTIAVNTIIQELGIKNAKVECSRIENYKDKKFDIITARAVAYVDKLLPWSIHLLKPGAFYLLMKEYKIEERELLIKLCKKYKLQLSKEHLYKLYDEDIQRVIYVLQKI